MAVNLDQSSFSKYLEGPKENYLNRLYYVCVESHNKTRYHTRIHAVTQEDMLSHKKACFYTRRHPVTQEDTLSHKKTRGHTKIHFITQEDTLSNTKTCCLSRWYANTQENMLSYKMTPFTQEDICKSNVDFRTCQPTFKSLWYDVTFYTAALSRAPRIFLWDCVHRFFLSHSNVGMYEAVQVQRAFN